MRIIPAIDLIGGRCVRLEEGDYAKQTDYYEEPLDMAKQLADYGINYLHLVDLDGAKAGKVVNWEVLERICTHTSLQVDFGGGIKTEAEVQQALKLGATQLNIGSLAVKQPDLFAEWIQQFGGETLLLSADARDGKIAVHGWQEQTELDLFAFVGSYLQQGIRTVVCTDISRDGKLQGPAVALYQELMNEFPDLQLVASGGVSSLYDLDELQQLDLYGVIIGKALYEGKISLKELQTWGER
jgi:phosphoribosylformimino-5-aminoimidazole carboxamide ribotide isomerase